MSLVTEVAATVEIAEVTFLQFSATRDESFSLEPTTVEFKYRTRVRAETANEPCIVVLADFLMEARPEEGDAPKPCCEICAQLSLTYKTPKAGEFSQEHLDAFGRMNGIYNAWPYWREFVQSSSNRMGLPALVVPSLKVGANANNKPDNQAVASNPT